MDETIETAEEAGAPQEDSEIPTESPASATTGQRRKYAIRALGIIAVIAVLALVGASQVFLITSQNSTNSQIQSIDHQIADLDSSVENMSEQVDEIAVAAAAAAQAAADNAAGAATPAPAVPAGFLPRFSEQGPDQALGLKLAAVKGPDAYSDVPMEIDPADGTKRVWMVWAHWCPYCQQELPDLNAWWPEASTRYQNTEFITVTTSMDAARGNPLDPYLESSQFLFPVVIDADTQIAAQFGVNAFPFWIVTDGAGTVLFRTAGALGMEAIEQLFVQLEEFDA